MTKIEGFVRIPPNKPQWLPLLRDLYRFEEPKVSGPGSPNRRFSDVIWTKKQALESMKLNEQESADFDELLQYLSENRQIMVVPENSEGDSRYLTRVAEIVRTVGHTYEYWSKGRSVISATRWLIEDKKVPGLVIPAKHFVNAVVNKCEECIPGIRGTNLRTAATEVCEAVAKSINEKDWTSVYFSEFQLDSTLKIIESRYSEDSEYKAQILTAGVGSGKTIGFSIASLIEARKTMLDGMKNNSYKKTCMFVYPRTQLAYDQFQEIEKFSSFMPVKMDIWLEMSKSYKENNLTVARGVPEKYGKDVSPFGIVVTTFETLKRRMRRPEFIKKMSKHLSTIVVDEVHLLSGISGGMSAKLLSRLAQAVYDNDKEIHWIGASATIARPDQHIARLFGLERTDVQVIGPRDSEMIQAGINHHIFARPTSGMSLLGALTNVTSLAIHQRRNDLSHRPRISDSKRVKSIGFADNLEMLGRWNDDLKENERTQQVMRGRKHPKKETPMSEWTQLQREIPYAWRFNKPLQRRLAVKGGDDSENPGDAYKDLSDAFDKSKAKTVCDSCHKGQQVVLGEISSEDLLDLRKLVYRTNHKDSDKIKAIIVDSDEFKRSGNTVIGSHELCPFLQAGACTWFPQPRTDEIFEIPGSKEKACDFAATVRSTVFSSKSVSTETEEDDEGIAARIFNSPSQEIFDVGGYNKSVKVDIVLASPSLEVGVDLPMLTESVLVKSVRNIASYRQKVGRVGRERNLDTMNVTLMTESNVDLHYYRQPRKLVSEGRLEPVPLMDNNTAIIACSAYGAVWEWLALHAGLPEYIQRATDGSLGTRLTKCHDSLVNNTTQVKQYISNALGTSKYSSVIDEAIKQVAEEISLFLLPAQPTYTISPRPNFDVKVIDLFGINLQNKHGRATYDIKENQSQNYQDIAKQKRLVKRILENLDLLRPYSTNIDENLGSNLLSLERSLQQNNLQVEELLYVSELISKFETEIEDLEEILEDLETDIKRLIRSLRSNLDTVGVNPSVLSMYKEYDDFEDRVSGGGWKRVYLSDVMDNLSEVSYKRRDSWFLRPNTLFENPYTKRVTLELDNIDPTSTYKPIPLEQSQSEISIDEAIYAFLPGTWNHRIPHRRLKVRTGTLTPSGGWVYAKLNRMTDVGNKFRQVDQKELPAPPGSDSNLLIYAPEKLVLIESLGKYVQLNKNTLQVMDKDETDIDSNALVNSKLPKSFQNRWAWSDSEKDGTRAKPFSLPDHDYQLENPEGELFDLTGDEELLHPICNSLIESVEWFEEKEIIEYTYGISRSFGGKGEISLGYRDQNDRRIGFGEKYVTQSIRFSLNKEYIRNVAKQFRDKIETNEGEISPSIIKCLKAFVLTQTENNGASLNSYTLDELISITMIFNDWNNNVLSPQVMELYLNNSKENKRDFRKTATDFIRTKMNLNKKYAEEDEEVYEADTLVASRVDSVIEALETVCLFIDKFDDFVSKWIHRTILSTFGIVATNSLQQFCGSDDKDVSYMIEDDSWNGDHARVVIYDKVDFGNGSCKAAFEYLHIPHIVRTSKHSLGAKLPSTDFLSTLEENLLQCMQSQSDLGALELITNPESVTIASMPDLIKHAKESFEVGNKTWSKLGIRSMDDAWTLPLHTRLAAKYEADGNLQMDDVVRSCTICWNGCPECVDQLQNALGGMLGMNFIDKFVLDSWLSEGIKTSEDYQNLEFADMADSTADMHFGSLNRLIMKTPEGDSKRSICLPWTMGFHIERNSPFSAKLVVRSTDISNLRIGANTGGAHGIDRHGFERLLWFNLLMSSHLDSVEVLPKEKKKLELLYYDARDLKLKDLGLSPRMIDSMMAVGDGQQLEKLSDVLLWMAKRDFEIKLCVDKNQATKGPIRTFLSKLSSHKNIILLQKESELGSMHKKILISPIAALTGSANLTFSGSNLNDETLVHVTANNPSEYESIKANARITLRDAVPFDFDYQPEFQDNGQRTEGKNTQNSGDKELDQIIQSFESGTFLDESLTVECKSSYGIKNDQKNMSAKDSTDVVFREVSSMMNTEGGYLFVGIENETWNVLGIDDEIKSRKSRDNFLGEVYSHLKHSIGKIYGSHVRCELKPISGKQVMVFSVKPSRNAKVWFKPRGSHFKRDVFDVDYGCLYVRTDDNAEPLKKYNEILDWAETRFGVRNI